MSEVVLTLPDDLAAEAKESGLFAPETAASMFRSELKRRRAKRTNGKRHSIRDLFGTVSLGHATGTDNDSIDRDLAKAYLESNEDED